MWPCSGSPLPLVSCSQCRCALISGGRGPPLILSWPAGICLLATGIFHALYFALLARAYEHGEISTVYPIARGSGVGLTAFVAYLSLGEDISLLGAGGIALVFAGILCVGAPVLKLQARGLQLALGVGLTIVCYSLIDKIGVGYVQPVYYICGMWLIATLVRMPFVVRQYGMKLLDDGARFLWVYHLDWRRLAGDLSADTVRLYSRAGQLYHCRARVVGSNRCAAGLDLPQGTAHGR